MGRAGCIHECNDVINLNRSSRSGTGEEVGLKDKQNNTPHPQLEATGGTAEEVSIIK